MHRRRVQAVLFVALLAVASPGHADDLAPLVTDRPGNGNAAKTVTQGAVQVETSVNLASDGGEEGTARSMAFPTALRWGATSWLEVRLLSDVLLLEHSAASQTEVGGTDVIVGTKIALLSQRRICPDLALLLQWTLPVGAARFSAGAVEPLALVLFGWALPSNLSLLFNLGIDAVASQDGGDLGRLLYQGLVAYALPLFAERLSLFLEGYGKVVTRARASTADVHQLDAGMAFLLTPDLQLDAFVQRGLSSAATDWQLAIGLSYRRRLVGGRVIAAAE